MLLFFWRVEEAFDGGLWEVDVFIVGVSSAFPENIENLCWNHCFPETTERFYTNGTESMGIEVR